MVRHGAGETPVVAALGAVALDARLNPAGLLCISVKTVEKHRSNIMAKLDLHNTATLTAFAFEHGLIARKA
jgi:FixJ family two-component response regulator